MLFDTEILMNMIELQIMICLKIVIKIFFIQFVDFYFIKFLSFLGRWDYNLYVNKSIATTALFLLGLSLVLGSF